MGTGGDSTTGTATATCVFLVFFVCFVDSIFFSWDGDESGARRLMDVGLALVGTDLVSVLALHCAVMAVCCCRRFSSASSKNRRHRLAVSILSRYDFSRRGSLSWVRRVPTIVEDERKSAFCKLIRLVVVVVVVASR